jgi:hypothetical protein
MNRFKIHIGEVVWCKPRYEKVIQDEKEKMVEEEK